MSVNPNTEANENTVVGNADDASVAMNVVGEHFAAVVSGRELPLSSAERALVTGGTVNAPAKGENGALTTAVSCFMGEGNLADSSDADERKSGELDTDTPSDHSCW